MPRYENIEEIEPDPRGAGLKIGIVLSRFNSDVGEGLLSACTAALLKHGVAPENVRVRIDSGGLSVTALRALPMTQRTTEIHRLEIPYGRFERRIALPRGRYDLLEHACVNGCLVVRLKRE